MDKEGEINKTHDLESNSLIDIVIKPAYIRFT